MKIKKLTHLQNNWISGEYKGMAFEAKIFDEPSDYGIDGGRVSKLMVRNKSGEIIFNYDRGLDTDHAIGIELAKVLERKV